MVSTGLGVIGDIGKKTYNILMEDDEDSNTARKTNVCLPVMLCYFVDVAYCIPLNMHIYWYCFYTVCYLFAAQCIVISPVCGFVCICGCVCFFTGIVIFKQDTLYVHIYHS